MNKPYNFSKNIKDKEQKILNYYKRISNIEQPKLTIIPRKKKGTKKNMSREGLKDNSIKDNELVVKDEEYEKDEKKLTKKRIVIMDD